MDENITEFFAQVNSTYNTSNGDMQAGLSREEKDTIIATFSNGVGCLFSKTEGILNFVLSLPPSFMGQTRGLLGNNNGDKTDEFMKRGTTNSLPDNLTDEQIFYFGQTCNLKIAITICCYLIHFVSTLQGMYQGMKVSFCTMDCLMQHSSI